MSGSRQSLRGEDVADAIVHVAALIGAAIACVVRRRLVATAQRPELAIAVGIDRSGLRRWPSFALFLDDGRVAFDNNSIDRAMRPLALGRHNGLFAAREFPPATRHDPRAASGIVSGRYANEPSTT